MSNATTPELVQAEHELADTPAFAAPTATPPEVKWRHAGWEQRREKIRGSMWAGGATANRVQRWDQCGACAVVEHSKARQRHRVTCWHCRDRWCQPCQVAKRCELVRIINQEPPQARMRFLTFTLRANDSGLREKITFLKQCFARLKKESWWKSRILGGVAVLEVKIGESGKWHPHLHAVVDADYMPARELSELWRKITGGSFIVDVRDCPKPEHAAGYLAKYLTKGVDAAVLNSPEHLAEAIQALRGARSYDVFGSWRGTRSTEAKAKVDRDPDDACCSDFIVDDWRPVASLREYLRALQSKEPWADAIRTSLANAKFKPKDSP